ncbi:hypothetical protein Nmel_014573 [Mimus melanotis]
MGQSPPDHGTGMTQRAEHRPGLQSSAPPASLHGYSITTSPQGDHLLILCPSTTAGPAVLHSTFRVSRLFPIPQGCPTLGTCSPPRKGWQPSGSVGIFISSTQGPEHGEKSHLPLGCATNSLCHPGEAGWDAPSSSVG